MERGCIRVFSDVFIWWFIWRKKTNDLLTEYLKTNNFWCISFKHRYNIVPQYGIQYAKYCENIAEWIPYVGHYFPYDDCSRKNEIMLRWQKKKTKTQEQKKKQKQKQNKNKPKTTTATATKPLCFKSRKPWKRVGDIT